MEKIHYNILNEILKVYDFDSWDSTESEFKDTIKKQVFDKIFVYVNTCYIEQKITKFFSFRIFDCDTEAPWPQRDYYSDKVRYNGKLIEISDGWWMNPTDGWGENETLEFTIDDIDNVKDCCAMFAWTSIKKVPLFNTSKVKIMSLMFYNCHYLESVPALPIDNVRGFDDMFRNCESLDDETKRIWDIKGDFYTGNILGVPGRLRNKFRRSR